MSLHKKLSFIKSTIRIIGYIVLCVAFPVNALAVFAGFILVVSEVMGIVEEVGE